MRSSDVLLLVGSPRLSKSSSEAIGTYLLEQLQGKGWSTAFVRVYSILNSEERFSRLIEQIEKTNVVVLAAPLYVDSSPAPVIRMMEQIKDRGIHTAEEKRFVAIVNSGFPESFHNDVALSIYQRFAEEVGFKWYGGLSIGGGGMIDGRPLRSVGWPAKNLMRALEEVAEALAANREFPKKAAEALAKKTLPYSIYMWIANLGFKRQAKKRGVDLHAKPLTGSDGSF